jgi:hypothetical protein
MDMKMLSVRSVDEIKSALPELKDDEKALLLELEKAKENPRKGVLELLEPAPPAAPEVKAEVAEKDDGVEKLNLHKEFNMVVHTDGLKHFWQDGKVFDRATHVLLKDYTKK